MDSKKHLNRTRIQQHKLIGSIQGAKKKHTIMANIFNKTNNLYENPKRNTFDLSFQNNLTLNMGELVPVFCKECIPGDSFKIDPTLSLRMMPLLFPVQTRLRAHLHFFYVTNRSLWKDWQDFIGNTRQSLELPYVTPKGDFKTGKLADYLGIPTTVVSSTPTQTKLQWFSGNYTNIQQIDDTKGIYKFSLNPVFGYRATPIIYNALSSDNWFTYLDYWMLFNEITLGLGIAGTNGFNIVNNLSRIRGTNTQILNGVNQTLSGDLAVNFSALGQGTINVAHYCPHFFNEIIGSNGEAPSEFRLANINVGQPWFTSTTSAVVLFRGNNGDSSKDSLLRVIISHDDLEERGIFIGYTNALYDVSKLSGNVESIEKSNLRDFLNSHENVDCIVLYCNVTAMTDLSDNFQLGSVAVSRDSIEVGRASDFYSTLYQYSQEPSEIDIEDNVFSSDIRISALPWRAYEAIYNSFYRDERNNPLIVDGEPVYNKFLRNYDGGEDDIVNRELFKRNWESDFLTSAVQSPQQGVAPLVGITVNGEISFKDSDTGEIYSAKLNASDGDKIDNFVVTSPNMPNSNLRQLVDFASSGISISDLRGVNALQRWLEINMRRGLRYKDQIMSHFGVNVHYDELMMPEFIGGMSTDIYINQINQTTPTAGSPLGSFAGQGGAFGSSGHSINHYCQEHGYIIGILSISPTPQYSQLLPKHFIKRELLDYFFPEFGHLGMQPISYKEVAPNESFATGQSLDDVFGYQRAWYDYLASVDEVHGLFRTNLNNFVVQRYFYGRPDLSPDFLTINPKTLDSVFAVNAGDDSHKFLGQVYFDCKVKRPIPEYGVPRLEV